MAVMRVKRMIKKITGFFREHKIRSIILITLFCLFLFQEVAKATGLMDKIRPPLPVDISQVKWKDLKSEDGQYSIKYPDSWKVWDKYPSEGIIPTIVTSFTAPYNDMYVFVFAQTSDENLHFGSLEEWINIQRPSLNKIDDIEFVSSGRVYGTKSYSGSMVEYLYLRLFSVKSHCIEWYVYHIHRGYTFQFCVNDDKWTQAYPLIQAMLESVELTNP